MSELLFICLVLDFITYYKVNSINNGLSKFYTRIFEDLEFLML